MATAMTLDPRAATRAACERLGVAIGPTPPSRDAIEWRARLEATRARNDQLLEDMQRRHLRALRNASEPAQGRGRADRAPGEITGTVTLKRSLPAEQREKIRAGMLRVWADRSAGLLEPRRPRRTKLQIAVDRELGWKPRPIRRRTVPVKSPSRRPGMWVLMGGKWKQVPVGALERFLESARRITRYRGADVPDDVLPHVL